MSKRTLNKSEWFMADLGGYVFFSLGWLLALFAANMALGTHWFEGTMKQLPVGESVAFFGLVFLPGFLLVFVFRLNPLWMLDASIDWIEFRLTGKVGVHQMPRRQIRYICRWL